MRSSTRLGASIIAIAAVLISLLAAPASASRPGDEEDDDRARGTVRFATFNASLNRTAEGELAMNLSEPYDGTDPTGDLLTLRRWQAANVAEVLQRVRPDVVLINEFDFDPTGQAVDDFRRNYLEIGQNGAEPIHYRYAFAAGSNTGIPSGFDLDNNGTVGGGNDAFGFGNYPGQFGMLVLSRYPIERGDIRTFQKFLWKDMPGNLIPPDFYDDEELGVFRLSSKSHWDIPIELEDGVVHFLVSHPTPPVFDGPEDRNGRRNHDEIRFWADYVEPRRSRYIYDDEGDRGGLGGSKRFVIAGDQNADPFDGDSTDQAIQLLLEHRRIQDPAPMSNGGREASTLQGNINDSHVGDPALDTADFNDAGPGNLRVDYVLPSTRLKVADSGVFWPLLADDLSRLIGVFDFAQFQRDGIGFPTSDHRLVWLDVDPDAKGRSGKGSRR